jgi:hypothetical protein
MSTKTTMHNLHNVAQVHSCAFGARCTICTNTLGMVHVVHSVVYASKSLSGGRFVCRRALVQS